MAKIKELKDLGFDYNSNLERFDMKNEIDARCGSKTNRKIDAFLIREFLRYLQRYDEKK